MGWMGASWLKRHLCAPFVLSLRQRWWESGDWRSTRLRANWEMKWVPGWVRTNLERVEKKNNDEKSFWPNTSTDQLSMNNKTTKPKKQINQILFSRVIIIVIRSLFVQSPPILRRAHHPPRGGEGCNLPSCGEATGKPPSRGVSGYPWVAKLAPH